VSSLPLGPRFSHEPRRLVPIAIHVVSLAYVARAQIKGVGMKHFAKAMEFNMHVRSLSVGHNQISDDGVQLFAATIKRQGTCPITTLNVRYGGRVLRAMNAEPFTRVQRTRRWNPLGTDSAHSLALALKYNRCALTSLDLSYTSISDEGAMHIAKALSSNTVLKTLNLGNAHIHEEGAACIAQGVMPNTGLEELCVAGEALAVDWWRTVVECC
jgi:hypothetical protein